MLILITICLFTGATIGVGHAFSDNFSIKIDPAAKQALGEQTYNEVTAFFDAAEKAIEAKDRQALMALYSDNYRNGDHDKKSVELIWKRIFSRFDHLSTSHNMKLGSWSANEVILNCTGLMLGKLPGPNGEFVRIDNWSNQDHVLIKTAGKWKLTGTYSRRKRKRLWFDKPMHPLF